MTSESFQRDAIEEIKVDESTCHAYKLHREALTLLKDKLETLFGKIWDFDGGIKWSNPRSIIVLVTSDPI